MKILRNSLPVVCFVLLLIFFAGWSWLDWKTTTILPWSAALLALFFCSLAAALSPSPAARKTALALTVLSLVPGIMLVTGLAEIRFVWVGLVAFGFSGAVVYLYDLARSSGRYRGALRLLLLLPVALIVYGLIALFGWNGALLPAWIGLGLLVLLALISLLTRAARQ